MNSYTTDDFACDLSAITLNSNQLWVGSGRCTVRPLPDTCLGVWGCYAPPFCAPDLTLNSQLILADRNITDAWTFEKGDIGVLYSGGTWYPDRIERHGTYHHRKEGRLVSLGVRSLLTPLYDMRGFAQQIDITNRGSEAVTIRLKTSLEKVRPRRLPLSEWSFVSPRGAGEDLPETEEHIWQNEELTVRLRHDTAPATIQPGATGCFFVWVTLTEPGAAIEKDLPDPGLISPTREAWKHRLDRCLSSIPHITTNIEGLEAYYRRSLISGLICLWEHPDFALKVHPATCGIDGGAVCSYVWDAGVVPHLLTLMMGSKHTHALLQAYNHIDLDTTYALTLDGTGVGVRYAYSTWAFVQLVSACMNTFGYDEDLHRMAGKLISHMETLADPDTLLIDFGGQSALLEMRGTGWEHITASPNAERAWCLRTLSEWERHSGHEDAAQQHEWRAKQIETAVQQHLWNTRAGWFDCLHPDGHRETVYSIQVFDALEAGVCTPEMEEQLLRHVRDDAFLARYGVHSISREDTLHFECNDPDWSGNGAYAGEGPCLANTLLKRGHTERGLDVLRRFFWMAYHYPYIPQESHADKPTTPWFKRANIISGLTGAEAILFGLAGITPQLDGQLSIHPHLRPGDHLHIHGFSYRGHELDIEITGDRVNTQVDGHPARDARHPLS